MDPGRPVTDPPSLRMKPNEFVAFLATMSATTALGIDMVLPAFGEVRRSFGLANDSTQVALTVTVYFLGLSLAQIFYGPLTDRFGRKPVLRASLGLYALAALVAGLAPNLALLLTARLLWGIGAAGPRVLLLTIARDVHDGDRLARVLSLTAAIFMIVPAVAPLVGQVVLDLSSWRWTFAGPFVPAVALLLWSSRLDETLRPDDRRPLTFGNTAAAFRAVVGNRTALGLSLAMMFDFAAFASFLASSELLFDRVYDRADRFALFFGAMSVVMGLSAFTSSRVVAGFGARAMILWLLRLQLPIVSVMLLVSIAGDGSPNFWLWFGLLTAANALRVVINPLLGSEAMQPMGDQAGTAASVMGTIGMGGGALLGSVTDRFISDAVTPLAVAYLASAALQLIATAWAYGLTDRFSRPASSPDPRRQPG